MKKIRYGAAALALALAAAGVGPRVGIAYGADEKPAAAANAAGQTDVPVKVVVLFSSGVGYFEHEGKVNGNSSTELHFKTNQINDILKSLVLEDLGNGQVSSVVYPSQNPLSQTLKSFQVDITKNPPLAELLNQLRGAKVRVTQGTQKLEGTILGLEKKPKAGGEKDKVIETWTLNLLTGASIKAVALDEVSDLELEDAGLQEELHKALAALAQARDQDKKPVRIAFTGDGERSVKLGYVVETPVWKSSYRLILSDKDKSKPMMQGWAIVENQTDNDWNNVQLSLVSGRPISFIEELYPSLYVPRPVVQPQLYASLRPQTYEEGMGEDGKGQGRGPSGAAGDDDAFASDKPADRKSDLAHAPAPRRGEAAYAGQALQEESLKKVDMNAARSVASVASAAKIGELFEYTVPNVTLPRQRSSMIPIVSDAIEVERLSIYNASVLPRNPLNGARVKNTTGKHLLQGPITVFDHSNYAGDAQIDNVPPGQERLISYGVDLQMLIDATKNKEESQITTGSIVKGVLMVTTKSKFTQDYVAQNKSDGDKALVIEHPRRGGWTLTAADKPMETTDAVYRFKESIAKGETKTLTVSEEIVQHQSIAILPMDVGQLDYYSKNDRIPKSIKEALVEAIKRKGALVDTQRQIQEARNHKVELTNDEQRTRENMKALAQNANAQSDPSYLKERKKLDTQEEAIDKADDQIKSLLETQKKQQKDLEDYLSGLSLEEK